MTAVEVVDSIEPLVNEWDRLAADHHANPFVRPGWISAWWRAFGRGKLRILAVYEDGHLTGVLPLRLHRGVLSSTTNSETPLFGPLAADEKTLSRLFAALFSQPARRIDLSLLDPTDESVPLANATAGDAGYGKIATTTQSAPYIDVGATTWDEYEKGLRKKFRSELRRRRRRLEEEGELTLEVYDGTARLEELLEEGLRIEGSGWKDAEGTSIRTRPAARRFYTEVAHWAAERGWLRLCFLRLGGRAIAFDYSLVYDRTVYVLKGGYDPAYRRYGPGMVLTYMGLAHAFSEGLGAYEFLGVSEPYKLRWASAQRELQSVHMFAPTVLGSVDYMAHMGVRSASRHARSFVHSPLFPARGRLLVRQGYLRWHRWRDANLL